MNSSGNVEQLVAQQIIAATRAVEAQVEGELERLNNFKSDDLEQLREERLNAMKARAKQLQEWKAIGHGEYSEIPEEKAFFDWCKKSQKVVCHFYRDATFRCKIVDKHLQLLAPKHVSTRFCKINAEKCPFLTDRLKIKVLPAVLILKDSQVIDRIVGFGDLGNRDEFSTEMMEWRLSQSDIIDYAGDKETPPDQRPKKTSLLNNITKPTGRKFDD
ncbi:unnamed protein product [Allacma fusca]|uniref:Phosducin domain-containing protein n=1 Tax=Allacma fusca TaxID=39272 RepID=A0A8J2PE44_9HEXA|nr:unnamed protein product [Allacma fusca]